VDEEDSGRGGGGGGRGKQQRAVFSGAGYALGKVMRYRQREEEER
jgi:hypothetical protein